MTEQWCQPMDCGKHTPRKFLLYFDDPDHGIAVFDNEDEARAAFERASTAWNCYLFGALPLTKSAPAASTLCQHTNLRRWPSGLEECKDCGRRMS